MPDQVWKEILSGPVDDAARQKLPAVSWAKRVPVNLSNKFIEEYNLGKGEAAVLNLALKTPDSRVVHDDFAARKCAKELNVPHIGTGGLLILAKQKGLIRSVSDAHELAQSKGLWLSDSIIKMLVERAEE